MNDKKPAGWLHGSSGEKNPRARLTADQVDEIRRQHAHGARGKDLAELFGVSQATISRIVNGSRWRTRRAS